MPVAPVAPVATYRVQLHAGFTFDDVARLAPYLARLGVSHVYCSPFLQSVPASTHGYDVVDHGRLDAARGGPEGFDRMAKALASEGLSLVADIVPNHMAADPASNRWLWDVLENGQSSRYASYFDIDWNAPEERLHQRVLLPVLGDHYATVLEGGGIRVERRGGTMVVRTGDVTAPVSPRTLDEVLAGAARAAASEELATLADFFGRLPLSSVTDPGEIERRHRDKEVLRAILGRLLERDTHAAEAVDSAVADLNADPDRMDELLQRQNYRLAHWKVANQELDYRRFFDVADLVALRTEDPRVFNDTHALILDLVASGAVTGLRIDHPDGLRDPAGYFERLRARAGPDTWIVVEKILGPGEFLRPGWAPSIDGTTGYEFLNRVGGLFVDPVGEEPMTALYESFTGEPAFAPEGDHAAKEQVLRDALAADVNRLTKLVLAVGERQRRARDLTRHEIHHALREVTASLDVYRTYLQPSAPADPADVARIETALAAAAERCPDVDPAVWSFLGDLLLLRVADDSEAHEVGLRFQQLTGAVMAKGLEDTAFYRHNRLICLNEVGGHPGEFGTSLEDFHRANQESARRWPATMLATSTHDTKRSEDVRARIALLSEIPSEWATAVRRWSAMNERYRTSEGFPDGGMEYLLYQSLVGAWPISAERLAAYAEKASREAKTHTSWTDPDPAYDDALRTFVASVLDDRDFVDDVAFFVKPLVAAGRTTSLAQTLLKLTCPGVPDIYQGCESWDLSLVDPDNRRPVDHAAIEGLLGQVAGMGPAKVVERAGEGTPKLWLIHRALAARRARPDDFLPGSPYQPVPAHGRHGHRVVAYARGEGTVVVAPRLVMGLERAGGWSDTTIVLPRGTWRDVLGEASFGGGDEPVAVSALLARFPAALLQREVK